MDINELCHNMWQIMDAVLANVPIDMNLHIEDVYTITKLRRLLTTLQSTAGDQPLTKENLQPLYDFLSDRWYRIIEMDLNRSYPNLPSAPANVICLVLAELLENVYSRYQLLMPTIKVTCNEISATELTERTLAIHEFILSDDGERIIEVAACLEFACEDGELKHTSLFNGQPKKLSKSEAHRVIHHSHEAKALYDAIRSKMEMLEKGMSVGAVLFRLSLDLKKGGVKQQNGGMELNAGHHANEVIYHFSEWLETLTDEERKKLMDCAAPGSITMDEIWNRLARPADAKYKKTIYCVELIAGQIDEILKHNPWLFEWMPKNIEAAKQKSHVFYENNIKQAKNNLSQAINNDYRVTSRYSKETRLRARAMLQSACLSVNFVEMIQLINSSFANNLTAAKLKFSILHQVATLLKSNPCKQFQEQFKLLIDSKIQLIHTGEQLIKILSILPQEYHAILIDSLPDYLPKLINNLSHLFLIMNLLTANDRINLVVYLDDKILEIIKNLNSLMSYLGYFEEDKRMAALNDLIKYYPSIFPKKSDVIECIKLLPEIDREIFIKDFYLQQPDLIQDIDQLVIILENVSQFKHSLFLSHFKPELPRIIKNDDQYTKLMHALPLEQDKEFLRGYKPKVTPSIVNVSIFSPNTAETQHRNDNHSKRCIIV